MDNSRLISIIKSFSAKEMREYFELVQSPYFNKNQNVIALVSYLKKCHPAFSSVKIEKKKIYSFIFPRVKYDDARVRNLSSLALNLAEEYLAQNSFRRS